MSERKHAVSAGLKSKSRKQKTACVHSRPADSKTLITGIAKAARELGISRDIVFHSSGRRKVYAYSVLPSDTTKIVRESADGQKIVGRLRNGQFKPLKVNAL